MRKLTKVVSALLSVTIIFSIITVAPFTVSATETDENTTYESNVEFVTEQSKETTEPLTEVVEPTEMDEPETETIQKTTEPEPSTTHIQKKEVVPVGASLISSSEDYFTYKEKYIKNDCYYDSLVKEMRLPYRSFVETLDKDTAFQTELAAWKVITLDPDSLVTEITQSQQCKYYEAILIDLLVRDTQEKSFIENVQSFKDSIHVSAWKKYINYNSKILDNTPITSKNADAILKEMKNMGNFGKALKYANTIGDYIDYAVDLSDLFDKLSKLEMIAQMSESYAQVLKIMSSKCGSNVYLKTAIDNVAQVFSKDITIQQIQYIFASKSAADAVYKEFMKEVKKQVISYLGMAGLAIDLAQSAGTAVANSWFGTTDMVNDYYEMSSLYEVEDLLRTALLNTKGETFCTAFKMYENICLMGCDYSKKYVEPLYTSLFGKLFAWATNQNYENYSAQLDDLKEQISFMFEMIDVGADSWYVIDTGNTENMNVVNGSFTITQYTKDDYNNLHEEIMMDVYSTYGCNNRSNITLSRDLIIYNDFLVNGGAINLNGHTLTVCGNATQSGGTVNIGKGNLIINGNLQQTSGTMHIGGGVLTVDGNYYITGGTFNSPSESHGILEMINNDDKVYVNRDFCTFSDNGSSLTAGTMYLRGNFSQRCYYDNTYHGIEYNFNCRGNHKVVFDGTGKQSIYFRNSGFSGFAYAEFVNNSNIVFSSSIRGWKLPKDTILDQDLRIYISISSAIDMNGYNLTILGDLYIDGSGSVNLNGGNLTVLGNTTIDFGSIDISGGLMKTKNLQHEGCGEININGGTLKVNENYTIGDSNSCSACLKMVNKNDHVIVGGNFKTISNKNHEGYLSAGVLEIGGDFIQSSWSNGDNFKCTGTYKVVFNGKQQQSIYFEKSSCSGFADVEFKNSDIIFKSSLMVNNWFLDSDRIIIVDTMIPIAGNVDLNGHTLTVTGDLKHSDGIFNLNNGKLNVGGSLTTAGTLNLQGKDIDVDGNLTQTGGNVNLGGGNLNASGNFNQNKGTMNIDKGTLKVNGNYAMVDSNNSYCNAYLKMVNENDHVIVGGDFTTKSKNSHEGYLSAGVLEIGGNFTESYGKDNFNCSGTHKVIFNGDDVQTINFNSTGSHFNILELTKDKDTGYIFKPDNCWNELIISEKPLVGDVNQDGNVDIKDATLIQMYLANFIELSDEQKHVADVDCDSDITILDATQIQKYLAELIPSLG